MTRHHNGDTVKAGFYFNLASWDVQAISGEGGTLGGRTGEPWIRVPAVLMLLLAPVMGAAYVVFLPFIGIYMVLRHLVGKAVAAVSGPQVRLAGTGTIGGSTDATERREENRPTGRRG